MLPPENDQVQSPNVAWRLKSPPALLGGLLVLATALHFAPAKVTAPFRDAWSMLLLPSQRACSAGLEWTKAAVARVESSFAEGERLAAATDELTALREQNRRLAAALEAARAQIAESSSGSQSATSALLRLETIDARVLGKTAQSFLRGRDLLDVGSRSGALPGAVVVDAQDAIEKSMPLVDAGKDQQLQSGRLVLAGRRVWGKLAAVGSRTSTVERTTDRGYRDAVQLARGDGSAGESMRLGPRGVLVGRGEALCRIELVSLSEPVAVGDIVVSSGDGVAREPLVYGHVVRVEQAAAGPHWQIWMQPAVGPESPRDVAVLKFELNSARMAASAAIPTESDNYRR